MYNKRWIIKKNITKPSKEFAEYLYEKYGLPECAAEICAARGILTERDADIFFGNGTEMLTDPFSMKGMDEAVERISEAVDNGEVITVFGDYDADGVTACSILYTFLTKQTEAVVYFKIPDRFGDGYGMSEKAVEEMAEDGTNLIITVDCGIKNNKEIEYASKLGIDVVVTDHHERGETLPACCAVVNPVLESEDSPLGKLCGAGVSYKLCEALGTVFGCDDEIFYELLAMAAVGTVGDSVPLLGENRTIVNCGLEFIRQGINKGINALVRNERCGDICKITPRDIAFTVVPKINAAGRMGDASRALELLTTPDRQYAEKLADELNEENINRKNTESKIYSESQLPEHMISKEEDSITVALGEGWHHGVIGIVASRLTEKTGKPSFVFAAEQSDPGLARGSARSVENFDLRKALVFCGNLLEKFGGHEMAAGLTVRTENIRPFIEKMNEFYRENRKESEKIRTQKIDLILEPWEITPGNFEGIKRLEPFGPGNEDPVICTSGLEVCDIRFMSEGKHARITFKGKNRSGEPFVFNGIKFNCQGSPMPMTGDKCSILYRAGLNVWQGRESAEPIVDDIFDGSFYVENGEEKIYNEEYITNDGFYLKRDKLAVLFRGFKAFGGSCAAGDIGKLKSFIAGAGCELTGYMIIYGLCVFRELGFVKYSNGKYEIVPDAENRKLEESETFRLLSE